MNALRMILLAGLALGVDARADAAEVDYLDFDCPLRVLPNQRVVGRVLGLDNFWQIYRARDRLMERVRATCAQGASAVRAARGWSFRVARPAAGRRLALIAGI